MIQWWDIKGGNIRGCLYTMRYKAIQSTFVYRQPLGKHGAEIKYFRFDEMSWIQRDLQKKRPIAQWDEVRGNRRVQFID